MIVGTNIYNMKDSLYDWYAKKAGITFHESKVFIKLLMEEEFAFNIFMKSYWDYLHPELLPEAAIVA